MIPLPPLRGEGKGGLTPPYPPPLRRGLEEDTPPPSMSRRRADFVSLRQQTRIFSTLPPLLFFLTPPKQTDLLSPILPPLIGRGGAAGRDTPFPPWRVPPLRRRNPAYPPALAGGGISEAPPQQTRPSQSLSPQGLGGGIPPPIREAFWFRSTRGTLRPSPAALGADY